MDLKSFNELILYVDEVAGRPESWRKRRTALSIPLARHRDTPPSLADVYWSFPFPSVGEADTQWSRVNRCRIFQDDLVRERIDCHTMSVILDCAINSEPVLVGGTTPKLVHVH